jgi:hypothetical protein
VSQYCDSQSIVLSLEKRTTHNTECLEPKAGCMYC